MNTTITTIQERDPLTNTPAAGITEAEEARYAELQQLALDLARRGDTAPLERMLRHGLPANLADGRGNSLLMLASYHGHLETARMLLRHGAEVDRRNDRGQTPLGGVAFKGYADVATLLLEHGANVEADNGGGTTPLMFAALFGRHDVAALLQRHGASARRRNRLGLSASLALSVARWIARVRSWIPGRAPRAA